MFDAIRSVLAYSWRRYDYVIFVRYLMGAAYLPSPMHKFAYRFFAPLVPKSDAMFFLDITPEVAYARIREGRKAREMFEEIGSLKDVRVRGLSLASIGAWTIIDADRTPSDVELEIRKHLRLEQSPANASSNTPLRCRHGNSSECELSDDGVESILTGGPRHPRELGCWGDRTWGYASERLAGIPIYLDYSWFVIFFLLAWTIGFVSMPTIYPGLSQLEYLFIGTLSALLLFVSILVHELAHSVVAKRSGLKIGRITLYLLGGVSQMESEPSNPSLELKMAAAGPLTSLAISALVGVGSLLSASMNLTPLSRRRCSTWRS